jgi:phosphoribosylamine--glycine ligase
VLHAGSKSDGDKIVTSGGRVLGVTAAGATLDEALGQVYQAAEKIHFAGAHYRKDIGAHANVSSGDN